MRYLIMLSLICSFTFAEDLGTVYKTYPIIEPDLLEEMKAKAQNLVNSGKWDKYKEKAIVSAKNYINNPPKVSGIIDTKTPKTFYYDPTFKLNRDLTDSKGKLIAKAGYYNPLSFKPFNTELIFINGNNKLQVKWAIKRFHANQKKTKIILTEGSFIKLAKKYKVWFYYDQGGRYTSKLNITQVPATVNQAGKRLIIRELILKGAFDA